MTLQDIERLKAIRAEINRQYSNVQSRRDNLAAQARRADPGNVGGIQERIAALDQRLLQMDRDLDLTGKLLQIGQGDVSATLPPPLPPPRFNRGGPFSERGATVLAVLFTVTVLAPLAFAFARRLLRRGRVPPAPQGWPESLQRLEQLERNIDTVAIEVERVSESQRFMMRMFTESQEAHAAQAAGNSPATGEPEQPMLALGAGPAQEVVIPEREAVRVPRG
jgi:archaellum component FlaC